MKRPFADYLPSHDKVSSAEVRRMFKTENPPEHPMLQGLISEFDGAIKYNAMLADHGRDKTYKGEISAAAWTREQCVEFARAWHAVAIERLRASELVGNTYRTSDGKPWNDLIPYCRNEPTAAMLAEAGK